MAGAGVALDEHVIGDEAEADLGLPQARPGGGVVVDVGDERTLCADDGTGGADAADGGVGGVGLELFQWL